MNPIIEFKNVHKEYRLGKIDRYSLAEDISNGFKQLLGIKKKVNANDISSLKSSYFWALQDINFSIYPAETIGIIGNNGAGKSTLLRLLTRITTPTKGEVKIKGKVSSLLSLGTGFHPELTGRENIYLNSAILRIDKEEVERKIDDIIDFAEIRKFIDTPVKRYSNGMYSRLAFAIAIHTQSDVIVLDEIFSVGDLNFTEKSTKSIEQLVKQGGRTAIIASHSLDLIREHCDRVIFIDQGKLIIFDTPEKAIKEYLIRNQPSHLSSPSSK